MRIPATAMTGHLMWTRTGTIWATWRLQGLAKGFGNSDINQLSRGAHRALFQAITGEYLLLGITADLDPEEVVNGMLDGIDITEHPGWAEEALLTLDSLADRPLGKREFWISVPLTSGSWKNTALTTLRQAETSAREMLLLPIRPPSTQEIRAALHAAGRIEEALPAMFEPTRATVAEQVWLAVHAQNRGLGTDSSAPIPDSTKVGGSAFRRTIGAAGFVGPAVFPEPLLDEGAQTDLDSKLGRLNPVARRYLKVKDLRQNTTTYQVMLALAGTPKGGWHSSLDWMGRFDEIGIPVDWAFRVTAASAKDAQHRNRRSEANLTDQMDQQEGTAAITGGGGELDEAAQTLADFHQALNATEKEVELQLSLIVAVGAPTADEARDRADFLIKDFRAMDFNLDRPLGSQEALWWAMQPGVPASRHAREFIELTTGGKAAMLTPLSSSDLGDPKGLYLADNITSGTARPVMLDLWGQIVGDVSGSIGIAGEPGGGKSVAMKDILGAVHDRGGRFIVIDRTEKREYGTFAESLDPEHTSIVDLTEPKYSLDPLRIFGAGRGAGQMLTFCSALLGVPARSREGIMLAELLDPAAAEGAGLTDSGALLRRLRDLGTQDDAAKTLAGLMGLYSRTEYGMVLFDADLPALDLNSRGIAFLTHGVSLPKREEIENPNLFAEMGVEKLFGRAMYALSTRISREICFSRRDELTVFAVDECEHMTSSPQISADLTTFIRDGRKHGAPVILASQDARDFGDEVTRGLIKNRILMRQTDTDLAMANLEWFHKGFGDSPELVQLVTDGLSPLGPDNKVPLERRGEGIMRDARGRMGKIRKTVSLRPARRKATLTTPGKPSQRELVA